MHICVCAVMDTYFLEKKHICESNIRYIKNKISSGNMVKSKELNGATLYEILLSSSTK